MFLWHIVSGKFDRIERDWGADSNLRGVRVVGSLRKFHDLISVLWCVQSLQCTWKGFFCVTWISNLALKLSTSRGTSLTLRTI